MKISTRILLIALLSLPFAVSCGPEAEDGPSVAVSPARVPSQGWVDMRGTGFTANADVTSHLRRPDGSEYPYLPIFTDSAGAFTHQIDTLLFSLGTYQVWVVDDATGRTSNIAEFEVTEDPPRLQ